MKPTPKDRQQSSSQTWSIPKDRQPTNQPTKEDEANRLATSLQHDYRNQTQTDNKPTTMDFQPIKYQNKQSGPNQNQMRRSELYQPAFRENLSLLSEKSVTRIQAIIIGQVSRLHEDEYFVCSESPIDFTMESNSQVLPIRSEITYFDINVCVEETNNVFDANIKMYEAFVQWYNIMREKDVTLVIYPYTQEQTTSTDGSDSLSKQEYIPGDFRSIQKYFRRCY